MVMTQTKLTEILPQAALYQEYTSVRAHNMANRFQPENQPNKQITSSEQSFIVDQWYFCKANLDSN